MASESPATKPTLRASHDSDGALRISLAGRLESRLLHEVWQRGRSLLRKRPERVVVDASGVTYCDSTGATMIDDLRLIQRRHDGTLEVEHMPDEFTPVLRLLERNVDAPEPEPRPMPWLEFLGRRAVETGRDIARLIGAVGEIVAALFHAVLHPSRVHYRFIAAAAQNAGVYSLPVVLLVSGLLGLIMGFQAAQTLHQYGGDIFLANLIGISFLRELAPLMTAVVLTARSGSAFAAELGTMQISEEIDALRTMGVNPVRFLVTPRMIATIIMTPLLTVFADIAGLAGGLFVWLFTLDMSFVSYLSQLEASVSVTDFVVGLVKATAFGALIAGVGCIRGMETRGSASAVGGSTTSAVVSGIVLIALTDAMFTVLFHYLDL